MRRGWDVGPTSYVKIERTASSIRRFLGLEDIDWLPDIKLLESLNEHSIKYREQVIPLDYAVNEIGAEGLTAYSKGRDGPTITVCVPPGQYQDMRFQTGSWQRARFSLFHEVAHAFAHTSLLVELGRIPHADAGLYRSSHHPIYHDSEWQADAISGAILMPAGRVLRVYREQSIPGMPEIALSDTFGVSLAAASTRLKVVLKHFERRR